MASGKELAKQFHALEDDALADIKHINNVAELVGHAGDAGQSLAARMSAVHSLRRVFVGLVRQGRFRPLHGLDRAGLGAKGVDSGTKPASAEPATVKVARWLRTQLRAFLRATVCLVAADDIKVQVPALRTAMHFVRLYAFTEGGADPEPVDAEGKVDAVHCSFGFEPFCDLVRAMLAMRPWNERVAACFRDEYATPFADVRFYLLRAIEATAMERRRSDAAAPGGDSDSGEEGEAAAASPAALLRAARDDTVSRNGFQLLSSVKCPTSEGDLAECYANSPPGSDAGGVPGSLRESEGGAGSRKRRRERQRARASALADAVEEEEEEEEEEEGEEQGDARPAVERTIIGGADWGSEEEAEKQRVRDLARGTGTGAARVRAGEADYDAESALFHHGSARRAVRDNSIRAARKRAQTRRQRGVGHVSGHRRAFNAAWLAFLRLPHTLDTYKRALLALPDSVLPHMTTPLQLATFLTTAYDQGGIVSALALNGLFVLMMQHNLEYPEFYPRLYRLLTPQLMHAKHRTRFFRMLGTFLWSTQLPVYLVSAFVKRMARLCLHAPPPAPLFLLPLIYNLIRRHSACLLLLRRGSNAKQQLAMLQSVAKTSEELAAEKRANEDEELRRMGVDPAEIDRRRAEAEEEKAEEERRSQEAEQKKAEERRRKRQRERERRGEEDEEEDEESGAEVEEDVLEPEAPRSVPSAQPESGAGAAEGEEEDGEKPKQRETFVERARRLAAERSQREKGQGEGESGAAPTEAAGRALRGFGLRQGISAELLAGKDPFDENEPDPQRCRAMESTLWEIATLRQHYDPSVARMANVFVAPMKRQQYDLEPLAGFTYASRMGEEMERRGKGTPAVEMYAPFTLFGYCDDSKPAADGAKPVAAESGAGVDLPRSRLRIAEPGAPAAADGEKPSKLESTLGIFDMAL